jgi:chaperonin GroES
MAATKYEPLEDRVVIKQIKESGEKTASGLVLDQLKKLTAKGEVVFVGAGYTARDTGVFVPNVLREGDVVLYGEAAGMPIEFVNEEGTLDEYRLMRESEVLCVVSEK